MTDAPASLNVTPENAIKKYFYIIMFSWKKGSILFVRIKIGYDDKTYVKKSLIKYYMKSTAKFLLEAITSLSKTLAKARQ